ncbi:hypothetical protein ACFQGT_06610 [Natrialbaceae archaeon GCM10025810]|uniref:DUF7109 family protein n=1 Tax=Halovalidus salilacus TaxID=3075124 RepID=UPI00360AED7F
MDATADELAGVVDLFGGLTRAELERALSEIAFRADGKTVDEDAAAAAIERALESFALVRYDRTAIDVDAGDAGERVTDGGDAGAAEGGGEATEPLLVAGPTAFPTVPDHAEDVPHILDIGHRRIDREALGDTAETQFSATVEEALEGDGDDAGDTDSERLRHLLDVSYDFEAWAPVDLSAERTRLETALESA